MKRKNRGKKKGKKIPAARGKGSQSLMTPVPLDKVRPEIRQYAEEVFQFIRSNPECTRNHIVRVISWATPHNVRMPLRVLFSEKRIAVKELTDYKWRFYAVNKGVAWSNRMLSQGKIEARKCGGKNQAGDECRAPDIFVREDGYCMHHGPNADEVKAKCNATRLSNQALKETKDKVCALCGTTDTPQWRKHGEEIACNACKMRENRKNKKHETSFVGRSNDFFDNGISDTDKTFIVDRDTDASKEIVCDVSQADEEWITVRIRAPTPKIDDTLRDLIKSFLNGDANILDLREAVSDE